jgi:hypothetical protein
MGRVAVVLVTALAVAVGGTVPATAAASGGNGTGPCSLLTRSQVADLLGARVERGRSERASGARACEWQTQEEGIGGIDDAPLGLTVVLYSTKRARGAFDELVRDQDNEIIDGIGDEAVADDTFPVPVSARVGRRVFEVEVSNYDTTNWDGDPRAIALDAAEIVADGLADGEAPEPVEQPDDVLARFADDIPVPASFSGRTAFGTEYSGGGAFGGDLTIDETAAFYEEALPDAGYEADAPRTEDVDGVPTTIIEFSGRDRTGTIEISPNDDPPGATLLFVTYTESE